MQHIIRSPGHRSESPASVPLPVSPQSSHGEFDALIELLASDEGRDDLHVKARESYINLRDANGQLDFTKIRDLFASSSVGNNRGHDMPRSTTIQDFAIPIEGNIVSDDAKVSTPVSRVRTSSIPTLKLSATTPTSTNTAAFTSGQPPAQSTPIPTVRGLQTKNETPESSRGIPSDTRVEPCDGLQENDTNFLTDLMQALDLAQREVMDLRRRCQELEELHASNDVSLSGSSLESTRLKSSPVSANIQGIANTNVSANQEFMPSPDDLDRAVGMVKFVDELVWKRSRFGAKYRNPYCAPNIQALQERLELWEQVVRNRR